MERVAQLVRRVMLFALVFAGEAYATPGVQSASTLPQPLFEIESALLAASPKADGRPFGEHVVEFAAGRRVVIFASSADFDAIVEVYRDGAPAVLGRDDDSGGDFNSRLGFTPSESGRYRIRVSSFSRDGQGTYRVVVRPAPPLPDAISFPAAETTMAWREVEGQIEAPHPNNLDRAFRDHRITLREDEELLVRIEGSAEMNVGLYPAAEREGSPLAETSGGLDDANVAVIRAPRAGEYVLRVATLGSESARYRLRIGQMRR